MFVFVFLSHNKSEYPFIKTFVLVKGTKEGNVLAFLKCQSLLI